MSHLNRYLPIHRIDEKNRMVWGLATDETVDAQDEIIDYEATKKAVAEWREWANIREMHSPSAVGVAQEIVLDDASRSLWIGAKIVDDVAWRKVRDGVYKGFSIGGKALRKLLEHVGGQTVRRVVEYILLEISLVDRPANPSARFELVKRDGGTAMHDEETLDMSKMADTEDAEDAAESSGDEEQQTETSEEASEEGAETEPGEEKASMTADMVKSIVIGLLKELGLVREEGQGMAGQGMALAAEVENLRKSLDVMARQGMAPQSHLETLTTQVVQQDVRTTEALTKVSDNLQKVVADMGQVATAVEVLNERLEKVEALPHGTGPVLRELSFGPTRLDNQTETVLKALLSEATDPNMREMIGHKLTELQIRAAHQNGNQ